PGGSGSKDIYISRLLNGMWSAPENLGNTINTPDDEMFPFISRKGTLYFASNGHSGMGGLDIFSTELKNGEWNPISNLEAFNSAKDDFAFLLDTNSRRGLFSSNRIREDDDIYYFEMIEPLFSAPDTLRENNYCFTLFEETTAMADTLPYVYEWNLGKELIVKAKEVRHCFPGPGTYPVYLNILDTLTGIAHDKEAEYFIEIKDHEQLYIVCSDTCKIAEAILFDASASNLPGFTTKNYFWDFGDGQKGVGIKLLHTYREAGIYYVRLGSELLSTDKQELKKSVVKKIVVINKDEKLSYEK
ncbi:MAG TPA: PKD domain-containing protein, partial [Cytophagaceae bacterium]|nr:PKD domain-containing protein [Cytophagaceae bacterium]